MPLPSPSGKEARADFISRCVSAVADEFEDTDQRVAVCNAQWRKAKQASEVQQLVAYKFRVEAAPEWLPLLPKPGEYTHDIYGDLYLTAERIQRLVASFVNAVYQSALPVDAEHYMGDPDGALGWIEELRINADGSVDARVSWTDRGEEMLANDRFRYVSPTYMERWEDNGGNLHRDVLVGAALTTRPWFKEDALRSIVAASDGIWMYERDPDLDLTRQFQFSERTEDVAKKLHEYSAAEIKDLARDAVWQMLVKREFDALSDEQEAAVLEAMEPEAPDNEPSDALQQQLDEAVAERDALQAQLESKDDEPSGDETQLKEMRDSLKTATAQIKTLSEAVETEKQRGDELRVELDRKRFSDMAQDWVGDTDKHVAHLLKLAQTVGEDDELFKFHVESQNAQAAQAAELTKTLGKDVVLDESTPEGKLEQLARKYAEDNTVDYHEAYAHVMQTPEGAKLYSESISH